MPTITLPSRLAAIFPGDRSQTWLLIMFFLSLVLPSLGAVRRVGGYPGIFVYLTCVLIVIVIGYKFLNNFLILVSERQAFRLFWLTLLGLLVAFSIVYPIANSGVFGGGSDRDEALNLAVTELLHLRYPYYVKTYLGYFISPLPGTIFLSIPFVILGNSAFQNFFWILVFFLVVKLYLKDGRLSLLLLWAIFGLSPEILREFLTGGYGLSNSIYILIFILFFVFSVQETHPRCWQKYISAILLGIGISSRLQLLLLVPLVFSMLVQTTGWKIASRYTLLVCMVAGAITLPFYLYDPLGFSPLHHATKISELVSILPCLDIIILLSVFTLACFLSLQRMDNKGLVLLKNCALVQAFIVLFPAVISMFRSGDLFFGIIGYGIYFLFFGTLYSFSRLVLAQKQYTI
jgi:hypothetical protein